MKVTFPVYRNNLTTSNNRNKNQQLAFTSKEKVIEEVGNVALKKTNKALNQLRNALSKLDIQEEMEAIKQVAASPVEMLDPNSIKATSSILKIFKDTMNPYLLKITGDTSGVLELMTKGEVDTLQTIAKSASSLTDIPSTAVKNRLAEVILRNHILENTERAMNIKNSEGFLHAVKKVSTGIELLEAVLK